MRYTPPMSRCVSLLILGLAACGSSSGNSPDGGGPGSNHPDGSTPPGGPDAFVPQDAPAGPFGCLGKPVPTLAPDPVVISGVADTVNGSFSVVTASGVKVVAEGSDGTALGSAVTDGSGTYSISLPTGGHALDVHLAATKSGDRNSTLYPATTLYESTSAGDIVIISQSDFNLLVSVAGAQQSSNNGAVGVIVLDCEGNTLSGATVDIPGGDVIYVAGGSPSSSATATDSEGVALVFNVPPGDATLSASVGGMTLRSHVVQSTAGVTTTAAIRP